MDVVPDQTVLFFAFNLNDNVDRGFQFKTFLRLPCSKGGYNFNCTVITTTIGFCYTISEGRKES